MPIPRRTISALSIKLSDDIKACEQDSLNVAIDTYGSRPSSAVTPLDVHTEADLAKQLSTLPSGTNFNYIYICGHGAPTGVGSGSSPNELRSIFLHWPTVATAICDYVADDGVIFLACCQGGIKTVAFDFFGDCDRARTVIGARGGIYPEDLQAAFQLLMYGTEFKGEDPLAAVHRVNAAFPSMFELIRREDHDYLAEFMDYLAYGQRQKYPDLKLGEPSSC
jgi:hypothetical protein